MSDTICVGNSCLSDADIAKLTPLARLSNQEIDALVAVSQSKQKFSDAEVGNLTPLARLSREEIDSLVSASRGEFRSRHWLLHEENDGFAIRDMRGPGDTRHYFSPRITAGIYTPGGAVMEFDRKINLSDRWRIECLGFS